MSNNIYDILKKIENLEGSRQTLTEGKTSKPDYIDIDKDGDKKEPMKKAAKDKAKGGMAEAVARVEQQLSEKFKGFKKSAAPEIGSNLPKSDIKTFGLEPGRGYDINTPSDWKPGDRLRDVQQLIPTQDKKSHIRSRLGKHVKPAHLPEDQIEESGLMYSIGVDKHGKDYMTKAAKLMRNGGTQEELGRLKDKESKAHKNKKMDEGEYNEDMLSPKQQKIARMAGDPDKIDAKDFAALRGEKKGKKDEGNEFSGELVKARAQGKGEFKVGGKEYKVQEAGADDFLGGDDHTDQHGHLRLSPAGAAKVQNHPNYDPNLSANAQYSKHFDPRGYPRMSHDQAVEVGKHPEYNPNLPANAQHHLLNKSGNMQAMKEGQDGPEYQKAWKRTQGERKEWEKSNPDKKYYGQGPAERHSMELSKARDTDRAAKDEKRGPLGRVANTLSRGLFGQEIDEGRTSMREGWEEMQKYLEKKRGPESKGGSGKKAGTRYGGSAQKDDDEATDGEGNPVPKKRQKAGRPDGTASGARHNYKKPKD